MLVLVSIDQPKLIAKRVFSSPRYIRISRIINIFIRKEGQKFGFPAANLALSSYERGINEEQANSKSEGALGSDTENIDISDPLKVIPIKSGRLCVTRVEFAMSFSMVEPICFSVDPGAITYIGDIVVKMSGEYSQTVFIDNEDRTVREAREKYSWLFQERPYMKSLPNVRVETVKHFKEIEELNKLKSRQRAKDKK